jgi:2-succinyl-5-enolpyruvyl-6-hydroxy-3-cyclohexene-1-carboxylate synthase
MSPQVNHNKGITTHLIEELISLGVKEYCICPGARNAPWIALLTSNPQVFRTYSFFEERSASFFALGRIRQTGYPVAVVTTSGTAVGELLPATMEAYYSGLPLILVSADRPRRYRGSGAPQTAEQVGLFGVYVSRSLDCEGEERPSLASISLNRPFHINVCIDEPLLEATDPRAKSPYLWESQSKQDSVVVQDLKGQTIESKQALEVLSFLENVRRPVAIVSMLRPEERECVVRLLQNWKIPAYIEGISGLREDPRLGHLQIHISDRILERGHQGGYPVDGIVRIGGVPTLRLWRDLDLQYSQLPVLSISSLPFSGLGRPSSLVSTSLQGPCELIQHELERKKDRSSNTEFQMFLDSDRSLSAELEKLLQAEPQSEAGMVAALSKNLPENSRVYLGNSLPIREWDLAASRSKKFADVWGSRGLNGIDGQTSSFFGFSAPRTENWAIVGDITALYDLSGPWILSQLSQTLVNLVIINNGGGKIFSRMFPQSAFQNNHQLRFHSWAEMWGVQYEKWLQVPEGEQKTRASRIIEIIPDENATQRFWKAYQNL